MSSHYTQRLHKLVKTVDSQLLNQSLIGLEKETLRVNRDGGIANTPHPAVLGSALTHPYITTDYSEALLEFITPPFTRVAEALGFLGDVQQYVYKKLDEEILWATSMPCVVAGETSIPIAQYGHSNAGMMKTIYRRGLGYRYGRVMQVIAGVHYNFSFADAFWPQYQAAIADQQALGDFISASYFSMLRNLQRIGWLVPYLFGASPAVCKSFLAGKPTTLSEFDENTYYEPYATSLRMGDIGYQNNKENETGIKANYDSLASYAESLTCAINTPCPEYEKIGVKVDGKYRQLNANILQIENEYYSTVRPKQITEKNEMPVLALRRRGVRYIELRSLDVNAFEPLGINETQLYFLEALMLYCLLQDSPLINAEERVAIDQNELNVAHRGREPGLMLVRRDGEISLRDWGLEICEAMQAVCEYMDNSLPDKPYSRALAQQRAAVLDPALTPSARMLAEMRDNGEGFYHFAQRKSHEHHEYFSNLTTDTAHKELLDLAVKESLLQQQEREAEDKESLDDYLKHYFEQA
ncbi:glutamate--cysteine ligase [Sulfuriflexus mobilis]|uniref:glutamate--cysteine ligase n=1 Tax=Sulfuriflexus mobilis TaxID=1811807 RepID=UPI000F816A5E|nr:glutamate--cysteine ligase [Sulfuriflexus mobilis]